MKLFDLKEISVVGILLIIIISSISAITYFNSEDIFDAKVTYINNQKIPYSIILNLKNKINQDLDYSVEILYSKKNLVVATDKFNCKNECERKLIINKIFFDKYKVIITTKFEGKYYKKELNFKLEKSKNKYILNLKKKHYLNPENINNFSISGNLEIPGKSKIILKMFNTENPEIKFKKEMQCNFNCNFNFNLKSNIVEGKYQFGVYLPNDMISKEIEIIFGKKPTILTSKKDKLKNNLQNKNLNKKIKDLDEFLFRGEIISKRNKIEKKIHKIQDNKFINLDRSLLIKKYPHKINSNILKKISNSINNKINNFQNKNNNLNNNKLKIVEHYLNGSSKIKILSELEINTYKPKNNVDFISLYDEEEKNQDKKYVKELNPTLKNINFKNIKFNLNKKNKLKNLKGNEYNILSEKNKKKLIPGIYEYTDENGNTKSYAFGLISINTEKPMYHKGEMVKFIIVVLDKDGFLYDNANIILNIIKPNGEIEVLSSEFKSIVKSGYKDGVYYGFFKADQEGKFEIYSQTKIENIIVEVESYFNIKENYEFEILRDVPATIDPWQGPFINNFTIIPLIKNIKKYDFIEEIPEDFTIYKNNANEIITKNGATSLIWKDINPNLNFNPYYIANSPLITPYLYELGKAKIKYKNIEGVNSIFYENRSWMFAIDPMKPSLNDSSNTCTATWGSDCSLWPSGSENDNTFDSCPNSIGGSSDEHVNEATVNVTIAKGGDSVSFSCEFDPYSSGSEEYMYYYNGVSWTQVYSGNPSNGNIHTVTRTVTLGNNYGTHWFRCIIDWNGENDECADSGSYYDNDDVKVNVSEPLPPSSNYSNLNVSNGANIIRGPKIKAFSYWNYTDGLNSGKFEHDGNGSKINFTVSSSDISNNWANYTFDTSNISLFSRVGKINMNFWAEDVGVFGKSSNLWFFLYDYANISSITFTPTTINQNQIFNITCLTKNENLNIPAENVRVNFYDNLTGYFGYSKSNSSGISIISKSFNEPGFYNISCKVIDSISSYYYASLNNNVDYKIIEILDSSPPKITNNKPLNSSQDIDGNINFYFNVSDLYSGIKNCSLLINGTINKTITTINNNQLNNISTHLDFNTYNWNIICYDDSTNHNLGFSKNWTIIVKPDTDGPIISLIQPPNGAEDPDGNIEFKFKAYDELVNITNCSLYINGILNQTNNSIQENTITSFFVNNLITNQTYFWNISCYDNYIIPNKGESNIWSVSIKIDSTPPTITLQNPIQNWKDTDGNLTIEYLAEDYGYNIKSCSLYLDGILNQTDNSISEITTNTFILNNLIEKNYNWLIECTDTAPLNNSGNSSSRSFSVNYDFDKPLITIYSPKNTSQDIDGNVIFKYNVTDENEISNCSIYINNTLKKTNTSITKNAEQIFSINGISNGEYNWYVSCYDKTDSNNLGTSETFLLTIAPDTTPPTISLISPKNNSKDGDGFIIFKYVPTEDISDIDSCSLYIDKSLEETDNSISNGQENNFNINLTNGNYSWYIECTDNSLAGNTKNSEKRNFLVEISPKTNINVTSNGQTKVIGENINFSSFSGDEFWSSLNGENVTFYLIENEGNSNATLPWQNSSFKKRKEIIIEELSGANLEDIVFNFTVNTQTLISNGDMQSDCDDLRFINSDNENYDYWIKSGCNTANTLIYLRVSKINANEKKTIGMYYKNSTISGISSKSKVLPLFDRFEGSSIDTTIWTLTDSGCTGTNQITQSSYIYEGNRAAELGAGDCSDGDEAFMDTTITVDKTETLSFYWKVSSESGYDFLTFCLDLSTSSCNNQNDAGTAKISGNIDWQLKTYTLSPGSHTIRFMYAKDGSVDGGTDRGYIDFISIPQNINLTIAKLDSISTQSSYITKSAIKLSDLNGFSNWIWDATGGKLTNYSTSVYGIKSGLDSAYNYTTFKLIPDTFNPKIKFINPTKNNGSIINTKWTIINVSFIEPNKDTIILEWGGVNETLSCSGNKPNYYCSINKSIILDGIYKYKVYGNDTFGNKNKTEEREIIFDFSAPVINYELPTPINNSKKDKTWLFVNTSIIDYSLDETLFKWNGVEENLVCDSTNNLNYNCSINKTNLVDGIYTYQVCANDNFGLNSCKEERTITIDTKNPEIKFISPTLNNDSFINYDWTNIKVEINEYNIDKVILEFNGVNESLSCIGTAPNYNCEINKSSLTSGIYYYTVYVNDTIGHNNKTEKRTLEVDITAPQITFVPPTDANNSFVDRSSTFINITILENNFNHSWINWEGINENLTCPGTSPNYNCNINKSNLLNKKYSYIICAIDNADNQNCSETRIVNINKTLPTITITSPINNSKYGINDIIYGNITLNDESYNVNKIWYTLNNKATKYFLTNISLYDWTINTTLTTGGYQIQFFGNDTIGNNFSSLIYYFNVLPDKDLKITKRIKSLLNNTYEINLNITNLGKWINYTVYDYIENNFTSYNFNHNPNSSSLISGNEYNGKILKWNITLPTNNNTNIIYHINGTNNYNLGRNYIFGAE